MITIPRAITEFREADDVNLTLTDKLVVNYDAGSDKFVTASVLSLLGSQSANQVLASPNGSSGNPSFRALVFTDLPTIPNSKLQNSSVTITAGSGMSGGGAVSLGSSVTLTNAGVTSFNTRTGGVTLTLSDLTSLAVDTRYHVLAGVSGGQIGYGGTGASETLSLRSTAHATKGKTDIGQILYVDEVNSRVGVKTSTPDSEFEVRGTLIVGDDPNQKYKIFRNGSTNGFLTFKILNNNANGFDFQVYNGTSILIVDGNNQRVGVKNASPANPLSVNAPTTSDTLAQLLVATGSTTNKGIVIQGVASQSANLLELQNSSGTILSRFNSVGDLRVVDKDDALCNIYMGGGVFGFTRSYNEIDYNAGIHVFKFFNGATYQVTMQSPENDTIQAQVHLNAVKFSSVGFGAYGDSGFVGAQFAGGVKTTSTGATQRRVFALHGSLVATANASYTGRLTINVSDYNQEKPGREGLRIESDGSQVLIGAFGVNAVTQQSIGAAATDAATTQTLVNNIRTALINLGWCKV